MKFFYIFHYPFGCSRDLWKYTLVRASDEKAARKVFRKTHSDHHIIDVLKSRC